MLFGLAQSLRSLTASPMAGLVQEAHRMARRRLEAGGSAAPRGQVDDQRDMDDFELPGDLDANELKIMEAKLRDGAGSLSDAPPLIVRRSGGRVVVPGVHVLRLGGGDHAHGRRFLFAVISAIRGKRGGLGQPKSVRRISGPRPSFRRPSPPMRY